MPNACHIKACQLVQEEHLIAVFNSADPEPQLAGAVEAARVVRDSKTGMCKGIAYVLFTRRTAALAARNLDGAQCNGRAMRVQRVVADPSATAAGKQAAPARAGSKPRGQAHQVGGDAAGVQGCVCVRGHSIDCTCMHVT